MCMCMHALGRILLHFAAAAFFGQAKVSLPLTPAAPESAAPTVTSKGQRNNGLNKFIPGDGTPGLA